MRRRRWSDGLNEDNEPKRGVVVDQCHVSVAEPLGVVVCGDLRAACLVGGAQEPVGAFFGDQRDLHRAGDHGPGIAGVACGAGTHDLECSDCCFLGLQVVLACECPVLVHRVAHQLGCFGVIAPALLTGRVQAVQRCA